MRPEEISEVRSAIKAAYPRAKWTTDEWGIWSEGAANIRISAEQAIAAVRNLKRTSDKYPAIATILRAMKAAEAPVCMGDPRDDRAEAAGLTEMRRSLEHRGLVGAARGSPEQVVTAYWRGCLETSVALRGYVRADAGDRIAADLIGHCGWPESEAADAALGMLAEYPSEPAANFPETPMQVWYVEFLERSIENPYKAAKTVLKGVVHADDFPTKRKKAQAAWQRMKQMRSLVEIERKGMATAQAAVLQEAAR